MTKLSPARALAELQAQHLALRTMMDRCEELADELEAGRGDALQLTREVARLRLAFEAHNQFEEQLLRPVLLANDAFAEVRIDRMIDDHVGEHRAMRARLDSSETVRDDVVTIESSG
ncbi:MAG: Hemerythrin cation binding domain [Deltaproteobacteria bacterium]|nr:Hemerythrin cation binding domain [Deltaproteobacteria bacterium]